MLALFVSIATGYYYYTVGGAVVGVITGVVGYAAFVVYSYIRVGMLVRDPLQRLALEANGKFRGKETERFLSAIILPILGAFISSLFLV